MDPVLTQTTDRPPRRTALVASEIRRYDIDIAALSETQLASEGSLVEVVEGYTFFWKGCPDTEHRIHGVAFAIKSTLLRKLPFFFFFFYYGWECRTGTMFPFSNLHPLRKGKEV